VSHAVVGAAIEAHRHLGAGLLESIYEAALHRELSLRGLTVDRQLRVPLEYKGSPLGLDGVLRALRAFVVNHQRCPACSKACSVFWSSIAIVIRPTPPGTGVIAPATSATGAYATSPTMR